MVVALQCGAKLMPSDTTLKEGDKKRRPVCLLIRRMKQEKKYTLSHANENPFDSCPPEESSEKGEKILPLDMNWSFSLVAFRIHNIFMLLYDPVLCNKFRRIQT